MVPITGPTSVSMFCSLMVSQYFTRSPKFSKRTLAYSTNQSTDSRLPQLPRWSSASGISKWNMVTSGSIPWARQQSMTLL